MDQDNKTTLNEKNVSGMKRWLNKVQNIKIGYILSLVIATLMVMSFAAFSNSYTIIGAVELNGEIVCQVSNQTEAKEIIEELLIDKAKTWGLQNGLSTNLQVTQVTAKQSNVLTGETLKQALAQDRYFDLSNALSVKLNGEILLYMLNQVEVEAVLNELMQPYQEEGAEVYLAQNLETLTAKVSLDQISNRSQALKILTQGKKIPIDYTIKAGDTSYSLARSCELSLSEFASLNPGLNLDRINVGQKIKLVCPGAWVDVLSVKTVEETQPINFEIEEVEDENLNYGQEKIVQEGKNGEKQIVNKVTKRNGVLESTEVVQETVTLEPQNQIVAVGSFNSSGHLYRPCSGVITSNFGTRWGRLHAGTDFGGSTGDPIYAAAPGVVIKAGNFNDGYGNQILLDHGNGLVTRYAHLSAYDVQVSQKVKAGEAIGKLGSTGNSTGPHLHFETIVNGSPQNPLILLEQ